MKKKIKGFTLTELLAVIVVLGLLTAIVIIMYLQYIDKTNDNIVRIETNNILSSVSAYYDEFKDTKDYVKEIVYEGNKRIVYSCVTLQSLIDMGYFKSDVNFSDTQITKKDTIVRISTVDGVTDYEILNGYDKDKVCTYYKLNKDFDSVSTVNSSSLDDDKDISFESSVSNVNRTKDLYDLNLALKLDVTELAKNYPVYVLLVMDKSGSMADNYQNLNQKRFTRSKEAAIALSKSVIAINSNSYIGMLSFDNAVENSYVVNFKRTQLVDSDFKTSKGNTNVIAAMDKAVEMISAAPEKSLKYVIFLSDGYPYITANAAYGKAPLPYSKEHYAVCSNGKVTDACKNALIGYRDTLASKNATLVVIGYEMGINAYKEVASVDSTGYLCPNPTVYNGLNRCYYESTSGNVGALFSSISEAILNLVSNINKGEIRGKFSDAITVYDYTTGEEVTDLVIDVAFDTDKYMNESRYKYLFHVNDVGISECKTSNSSSCYNSFDLVQNFTLDLYSQGDVHLPTIELESPKINIDAEKDSYLN